MTPYHRFHLVNRKDFRDDEYEHGHGLKGSGVPFDDRHLQYLHDFLVWIPSYNPAKQELQMGLCYYGPTVIRTEGAAKALSVFHTLAELFALGPESLYLTGLYNLSRDEYTIYEILRDDFVGKLKQLASYAQMVIDHPADYFILHMGI